LEFEKQVSFCRDYWGVILTTPQQTAPSEDFVSRSPFYVLLLSHASKLEFDVKRGEKKLSEMTAELEVLRKERHDLEVVFTVRAKNDHRTCGWDPDGIYRLPRSKSFPRSSPGSRSATLTTPGCANRGTSFKPSFRNVNISNLSS